MTRSLSRSLVLAYLAILTWSAPVAAHPGHGEEPPPPSNASPRTEARSELFELVAVLGDGGRAWLYLDRADTNLPIDNAQITIGIDGREVPAERSSEAVYVVSDAALAEEGARNLTFTVTAGEDIDLLAGVLTVPAAPVAAVATGGPLTSLLAAVREPLVWGAALGVLLLGGLLGRFSAPRRLPPWSEEPAHVRAGIGLQASDALAQPVPIPQPAHHAASHPAPREQEVAKPRPRVAASFLVAWLAVLPVAAEAQPVDPPRRQPDGSVFVPKPTQRLLAVRTLITGVSEAPVALNLAGTVIADPNASGLVQASQGGRIEAPERGFPTLGQRVERGQTLAFVVPALATQERSSLQASLAELDQQIVIAQQRANRLAGLAGSVSAREIAEARAELEGLRKRRAALAPSLNGREAVLAPASGVISVSGVAAGQMVDAREALFEVVDPDRLWVEAIAFDAAAVADVTGATAVTSAGQAMPVMFIGRGLALREQGVPLQFRIIAPPSGLSVGTPVTVTVQTARRADGIVLPQDAVVRSPEGPPMVFEKASAERFVPRSVRVQPLDGKTVVVLSGIESGRLVVSEGAGLIAQVR